MSNATKDQLFLPPKSRWAIALAVATALATLAATFYSLSRIQTTQQSSSPTRASFPAITAVTALGYLEPQGEVIHLSTPTVPESGGARVDHLLVKQGDKVRAGQVIAILNNYDSRLAALKQAQEQVKVAQAHLAQVRAGAKAGVLNAQKATIVRLEAELSIAQTEFRRYQALFQTGAIAASLQDSKRLVVETTQGQLNQAKSTLTSIAEVRSTDVEAAQTEVGSAIAAVMRATADLDLAKVRAPKDSQVLKIHTWPGEIVSNKGIVDLGQTKQMYAVAEVYEKDIGRVHLGQRATITSLNGAFQRNLLGTVDEIGREIGKKDVLDTDPAADVDARVVEVKIHLDPADSQKVTALSNLKVNVAIIP